MNPDAGHRGAADVPERAALDAVDATGRIGLAVFDVGLRCVRINRRMADFAGASAEASVGRSFGELMPDPSGRAEASLRRVIATGEPVVDVEIVGPAAGRPGPRSVWLTHWSPLRDDARALAGVCVVAHETPARGMAGHARAPVAAGPDTIAADSRTLRAADDGARRQGLGPATDANAAADAAGDARSVASLTSAFDRSSADEIMGEVGAQLGAELGITACNFCEVDEAADRLVVHYGWRRDDVPDLRRVYRLSDYITERVPRGQPSGRDDRDRRHAVRSPDRCGRVRGPGHRRVRHGALPPAGTLDAAAVADRRAPEGVAR
jgi:hypothetical protein